MTGTTQHRSARVVDPARAEADLLERCRGLVEAAMAAGAEEAEAFGVHNRSIAVRFEKGDLKLTQVDDGSTLGLRVFRGRRLGFVSTNRDDHAAFTRTAAEALSLAALSPPDAANRLPAKGSTAKAAPTALDFDLGDTSVEDAVDLGKRFVSRVKDSDARLAIDAAGVDVTRGTRAVASSAGVEEVESDAALGFSVMGMAIEGSQVSGMHYDSDVVRQSRDLAPSIERIAREFIDVTLGNLDAERGESYRGAVVLAPAAVLQLLARPLVGAASAIAVQRKRSPLAGRLGDDIASTMFTLYDDPRDATLAGAASFDREGQSTTRFTIVEGGRLASYLYNGYAAAVDGVASTAHAQGGARSVPALGAHALVLSPGRGGTREDLFRRLGRGLYIQRFSGTVDPVSGDFSGVAKSARWIEHGAIQRSLGEMLISGNVFALLKGVQDLSTTSERCSGSALAPYALVDGVSVTAG